MLFFCETKKRSRWEWKYGNKSFFLRDIKNILKFRVVGWWCGSEYKVVMLYYCSQNIIIWSHAAFTVNHRKMSWMKLSTAMYTLKKREEKSGWRVLRIFMWIYEHTTQEMAWMKTLWGEEWMHEWMIKVKFTSGFILSFFVPKEHKSKNFREKWENTTHTS